MIEPHERLSPPSPALIAHRDREAEVLRDLRESYHTSVIACVGYHDQRRPAGRTVVARFFVEYADGMIEPLCSRCAYGWAGEGESPRVGRIAVRYPE